MGEQRSRSSNGTYSETSSATKSHTLRPGSSGKDLDPEVRSAENPKGVKATFLSGSLRGRIASILEEKLPTSVRTQILAGFTTVDGMAAIETQLAANPGALDALIVGLPTYRSFETFDRLLERGVSAERLRVHLGHTRATKKGARQPFYHYHPRMHGCLFLMEDANGTATAVIGPNGLTGFSLLGLSIESAVMLEGEASSSEFEPIRRQIESVRAESARYEATRKEGYVSLSSVYFRSCSVNATARPGVAQNTIVILSEGTDALPEPDEAIYFDVPSGVPERNIDNVEIHLYLFDSLPPSPEEALERLSEARASFRCGGAWSKMYDGRGYFHRSQTPGSPPRLIRNHSFLPPDRPGFRRYRAIVRRPLKGSFRYHFEDRAKRWTPELDESQGFTAGDSDAELLKSLSLIPPHHLEWHPVRDLAPIEEDTKGDKILRMMWPEAGGFVLRATRLVLLPESPGQKASKPEGHDDDECPDLTNP